MVTIYGVRFVPPPAIGPREKGLDTRRRAGLVFGAEEVLVSTGEDDGVQQVTEAQLKAILHDSNLRDPTSIDTSPAPLRVREVEAQRPAAPKRAGRGAEELPEGIDDDAEPEEGEPNAAAAGAAKPPGKAVRTRRGKRA